MKKAWKFFINHVIDIIFILFIMYYLFACSYYMHSEPGYKCIALLPVILVAYYVVFNYFEKVQNKNEKKLKIIIVIGSFLIYLLWELFNRTPLISDYESLWDGAKHFADGTFGELAFNKTNYFYVWNHQVGYATLLGFISKIVGHHLFLAKLIEFLMLSFSNLFLYNVTKNVLSKRAALLTTIIYSTFLFNIGGSGILNNQHMSMFFILFGCNILTNKKTSGRCIISSILFAFAYIARPDAIVFILAVICYIIWTCMKEPKFETVKRSAISLILLVLPFVLVVKGYDYALIKTKNIPDSYLTAHAKYFKFILGTQWQHMNGLSNWDDLDYYEWDYDAYNVASKDYIINKYKTNFTSDILPFWYGKMIRFSAYYDWQIDYAGMNANSIIGQMIRYYGYGQYVLCLVAVLGTAIMLFNRKYDKLTVFKLLFIGLFLVHIPIEVQSRYRYPQYIAIAIIASPILLWFYDIIKVRVSKIYDNIKTSLKNYEI